jgi:hypothetical protein
MSKKKMVDKGKLVADNNDYWNEQIGGIRMELPLNRNLSLRLFGQLQNLLERTS